ncbi:MAG TPA: DUF456 domain-containing protein [Bacteroidales bacterium]|nr:DUF456 domain-containing protein [Bacteroidales bacterium]
MDYLLAILALICILAGIAGSILPGLPGPPVSYLGLLLIHWSRFAQFSTRTLIIWAVVIAVVAVLDYVVPVWGTKMYGGTKAGLRGSTVGLIIGMILLPLLGITLGPLGILGIIGGPFAGAWIGELLAGKDSQKALRSAFGSFIGFLAGTMMKVAVSLVLAVMYFKAIFQAIF